MSVSGLLTRDNTIDKTDVRPDLEVTSLLELLSVSSGFSPIGVGEASVARPEDAAVVDRYPVR